MYGHNFQRRVFFLFTVHGTRECTLQEFSAFARSQYPHFDLLESNWMLHVRQNAVLEILDPEDVNQNGLLSKPST